MYLTLVWLTGIVALGAAVVGYLRSRDTFHPLMFIGPMLAYPYFVMPLELRQGDALERYLPAHALPGIQAFFLFGVACLALGVLSAGVPRGARNPVAWNLTPALRRQLRRAGVLLGITGVVAYAFTIWNVGGLQEAYGEAHGRGWSSSGYVREAKFWVLPGLLFFMLSRLGRPWRPADWAWVVFMAAPLGFHGVVGGWRGQTFALLATLGLGWYMMRSRRPRLLTFAVGGVVLALLVLTLVTHRDMLALEGDDFEFRGTDAFEQFTGRASPGHEYIYGGGVMYDAAARGAFDWGGRYVLKIFIRPIPRAIWPTQYEDAARWLGLPRYGLTLPTLGWGPTRGASMGLMADMYKQFWWLGLGVLFLVGRAYGAAWRRASSSGGLWVIVYVLMVAFSLYLTQQTLQAVVWRVMLLGAVSWTVWRLVVHKTWRRAHSRAAPPRAAARRLGRAGLPG